LLNDSKNNTNESRNVVAFITPHSINNLDTKNPYVMAWWSAAFPGFGHLILGHYFLGIVLILHEIIINTLSGLNTAIYYSMIGEIETAKQTLDTKWIIAYIGPYIFAIWDCYQKTLKQNEDYAIAYQSGYEMYCKNRLDIKNPIVALIWSYLAPGAGHVYIHRLPIIFLIPWFVIVVYISNLLPAVHFIFVGDFENALKGLNPQWLLYLPSMYGFITYDAYIHTLEYNKVYKMELKRFLERRYQNYDFPFDGLKSSKEKLKG
jgi:hypothetical protein